MNAGVKTEGNPEEGSRSLMEGSSRKGEEDVAERTATFYLYHPCYVLQQALNLLFRCLGFEIGTNTTQHKSPLVNKTPSDSEEDHINPENTVTNDQKCSEEVSTSAEEAADHREHSPTTQNFVSFSLCSNLKP